MEAILRCRVQMQKDTAKSMNSNGVLPLVELTYCYGHECCPLLLKSIPTNTKKYEWYRTYYYDEQLMHAFRMTQTLPPSLKTGMLHTSAKKYWHSPCSAFHVMQWFKKGERNPNWLFGIPDILVHTGSPKQKTSLFLLSFRKTSILLFNSHQT